MLRRIRSVGVYGVLVRPRAGLFAVTLALSVAASMFEGLALVILIPLISGASGDDFSGSNSLSDFVVDVLGRMHIRPTLLSVIAVFSVLGVVSSVCSFSTTVLSKKFMHDSEASLRRALFRAVFSMRWGALGAAAAGRLAKSFLQDAQNAGIGIYYLMLGITAMIAASIYLGLSLLLSPGMTALTLGFGLVMTPVFVDITRRGRRSSRAASAALERLSGDALAAFHNAKFVLAQHLAPFLQGRVDAESDGYRRERVHNDAWMAGMRTAFELAAVAFVAGYLYLSIEVLDHDIAVTLVFLVIFYRLLPKLLRIQETLFSADSQAVWLRELLALQAHAERERGIQGGHRPPTFERGLELRDVTFRHDGATAPLIEHASLTLAKGACVAVVGPSGHGKSTLLDLVTGLVTPEHGAILVDGVSLADLDQHAWRDQIGFVLQDSPIFDASVRDNIVLDRIPIEEGRFTEVCEMAGVDEFVGRLPTGYDTVVGERGAQISGGQRQRIAIARALYRRPVLLLLDEPTSSLDGGTERVIVDTLSRLKGSVTMLVVSHGTALVDVADDVHRLVDGALVLESPR